MSRNDLFDSRLVSLHDLGLDLCGKSTFLSHLDVCCCRLFSSGWRLETDSRLNRRQSSTNQSQSCSCLRSENKMKKVWENALPGFISLLHQPSNDSRGSILPVQRVCEFLPALKVSDDSTLGRACRPTESFGKPF